MQIETVTEREREQQRRERMFDDLTSLRKHVDGLASRHEGAHRKSLEATRAVRDLEEAVKMKESMVLALVSGELDPGTNKPRYTSVETRKAAAQTQLASDSEYQGLKDKLFDTQGTKMNADLELGGIEQQWKSAGVVRDILVAQTRLLTADFQ